MKKCPVCEQQSVGLIAVIAAAFGSDSRCSACGSAVRFSSNTNGLFAACALLGFGFGYYISNFVIGGIVALILIAAVCLRAPLRADATDSTAVRGLFRKEVADRKESAHPKDPIDRGPD